MECCGNVKCPFCGILFKKELLDAHKASCPANPQNMVNEMAKARYKCTKCKRTHETDSGIGIRHIQYKELDQSGVIEPVSVVESTPEKLPEPKEEGGIGGLKLGGRASESPPTPPNRGIPVLQKEDRTFEKLTMTAGSPELCKYIYWARDSCVDCQGHRCAAAADKKLAPDLIEDICRTSNHLECAYYIKAIETGLAQICPYQGPPPPEKTAGCSGGWCYADDRNIRVPKSCKKFWVNCDAFARKKWAGKPFYRDLPKILQLTAIIRKEDDVDLEEAVE